MIRFLISLVLLISAVYLGQTIAQVRVGPYEQSPGIALGPGLYYDKDGKLSLMAGPSEQTIGIAQMVRGGGQAIAHNYTGTLVLTADGSAVTYTFTSSLLQPGDWGWVEQGSTGVVTFSGTNVTGVTATTGQYSRFMWYFDGTKVSIK